MTKTVQKRDNDYYQDRLEREHPEVFADFKLGKFKNLSAALKTAGLKKEPAPLTQLTIAWGKASDAEKDAFRVQIGCAPIVASAAPTSPPSVATLAPTVGGLPLHKDGHLTAAASKRIKDIIATRRMSMGDVMQELGYSRLNMSLAGALHRDNQIRNEQLLDALGVWLQQHGA